MEHFEIKNRNYIMIRKGLGIFLILTSLIWVISFAMDTSKITYLIVSVIFTFCGIYQITNGLGLERSWFRTGDNYIIIKWMNKINPVQIHDTRIARIHLTRYSILIRLKAKKPMKLNLGFLEQEQKKEVYEFMIDYAKKRNLELIRDF